MPDPHPDLWRAQGPVGPTCSGTWSTAPCLRACSGSAIPTYTWSTGGGRCFSAASPPTSATASTGRPCSREAPWPRGRGSSTKTPVAVLRRWLSTRLARPGTAPGCTPPAMSHPPTDVLTVSTTPAARPAGTTGPAAATRSASWSSETVTGIDGTAQFSKEGLLAPACWNHSSSTPRVATACGTRPTPMRSARASYPTTSCAAPTAPTGSPTGHRHGCSPAPRRASSTTRSSESASGGSWSWPAGRTCTPPATSLTRACGAAMHPPPARIGRTGRHRGACWTPTTPGRRRGWPAAPTAPPWPSPTHGRRKRRSSSRAPAPLRPGPGWRYSTSPGCGSHRCPPRSSSPQVRSRSTSPPVSVTDPHPPGA